MSIADRLREARKRRGLTQRELAAAAGMSVSSVRKIEQGEWPEVRLETLRRLAVALKVATTSLVTEPAESRLAIRHSEAWVQMRRALNTPTRLYPEAEQPTLNGLAETFFAVRPLFERDQFEELALLMPALLRDADILAETGPDREARELRVQILHLAGWLLTQTRQFDAAKFALDRALDDAPDRLSSAVVINTYCWMLLRTGQLDETRALAARWADDIEPRVSRATIGELAVWGVLLLRVSAAAVRDNRPGEADDALRLATVAAAAMGRESYLPHDFIRTFGPTTIALKRAENAAVIDRPDLVLDYATRIPTGGLMPSSNNMNRHQLDVAAAHTALRQYTDAVDVLDKVRRNSPQWLPNQRLARDIVNRVVARRRTLTPEMCTLADAVGLPL